VWTGDIGLLRAAGVNCIRLYAGDVGANAGAAGSGGNWKSFLDALWNGGTKPIYVVMTTYMQGSLIQNGTGVTGYLSDWQKLVKSTVNHPAVLGYMVGNEIYSDTSGAFWTNYGKIVDAAHAAGLTQSHDPFLLTAIVDNYSGGTWSVIAGGEGSGKVANLDAWAINVYRGAQFSSLFPQYKQQMTTLGKTKPLIVGEFGTPHSTRAVPNYGTTSSNVKNLDDIPASQMGAGQPYYDAEPAGSFLTKQMQTVKDNTGAAASTQVCAGGFIFGFADEWYKAGNPNSQLGGPNNAFQNPLFAGGYFDESWFGLTQGVSSALYTNGQPLARPTNLAYAAVKKFYNAAMPGGGGKPVITVKAASIKPTNKPRATLQGTVTSKSNITSVKVKPAGGKFLAAKGKKTWRFPTKLKLGKNRFVIQAKDASGKVATKNVIVTRKRK
jgi:hypothetical protein